MKVGILGGGLSGLYAAMLLQDSGVDFEIIEMSSNVGGRLRTKRFSSDPFDYHDLGGMRFPQIDTFWRLFDVIDRINMSTNFSIKFFDYVKDDSTFVFVFLLLLV